MNNYSRIESFFFEFLQVAVNSKSDISAVPTEEEWQRIYTLCIDHSLLGIAYVGLLRLPKHQRPRNVLIAKWSVNAEKIKAKNKQVNEQCGVVSERFFSDGYWCCMLKGQSNLCFYPADLGQYRTAGDIDVLLPPLDGKIGSVISYANRLRQERNLSSPAKVRYHHVDLSGVFLCPVEIHFRPSFMNSPLRNYRIQRWFRSSQKQMIEMFSTEETSSGTESSFYIHTPSFDVIYQLNHIYRHLFDEGIGLRQVMDYYYVLRSWYEEQQSSAVTAMSYDKTEINNLLRYFGMLRFASSLMWVIQKVFAMPEPFMLCPPDAKTGDFLLSEILSTGNFGHADNRYAKASNGVIRHAFAKTRRNVAFLKFFPEEVLCEPIFRVYHWLWRILKLWR